MQKIFTYVLPFTFSMVPLDQSMETENVNR